MSPARWSPAKVIQPGRSGSQNVATRNSSTAARATWLAMPTAVSPAVRAASVAPMAPGVGAAFEMADPTRYTSAISTTDGPPPNASTAATRANTLARVMTADPPNSSTILVGRWAISTMPWAERRSGGTTFSWASLRRAGMATATITMATTTMVTMTTAVVGNDDSLNWWNTRVPSKAMNTPTRLTWTATPAMVLTPMAPTATA